MLKTVPHPYHPEYLESVHFFHSRERVNFSYDNKVYDRRLKNKICYRCVNENFLALNDAC